MKSLSAYLYIYIPLNDKVFMFMIEIFSFNPCFCYTSRCRPCLPFV